MAVKHRQASTNLADNVIEPPIRKQKQHMRRSIQQSSSLEACCCLLQFPLIIFKCQVLVICTPRSPPIYIYVCVCYKHTIQKYFSSFVYLWMVCFKAYKL